MHTHATGRRSSSPVPARRALGAGRAAFANPPASQPAEPPDYDTWLHNAEAFGHHFAALPAPVSQPVQRKADEGESANPYALPAGVRLNALRTSSGPAPIQGFGIPGWAKAAGRWVGRGAKSLWDWGKRKLGYGGNQGNVQPAEDEHPLIDEDQQLEDEQPESLLQEAQELPSLPSLSSSSAVDEGLGLGPSLVSPRSEIVPPSFSDLERDRLKRPKDRERRSEPSPSASKPKELLSTHDRAKLAKVASSNSSQLSGHGRALHGTKALARPASQNNNNARKSVSKATAKTISQTENRLKKEQEKKDKKKDK